jgi:hypothetical protein
MQNAERWREGGRDLTNQLGHDFTPQLVLVSLSPPSFSLTHSYKYQFVNFNQKKKRSMCKDKTHVVMHSFITIAENEVV